MGSMCIVELHVTINYINMSSVVQRYFYEQFFSPEATGRHAKYPIFLSDFNKIGFARHIFMKVASAKFHRN